MVTRSLANPPCPADPLGPNLFTSVRRLRREDREQGHVVCAGEADLEEPGHLIQSQQGTQHISWLGLTSLGPFRTETDIGGGSPTGAQSTMSGLG